MGHQYPKIADPIKAESGSGWVIRVERAPGDVIELPAASRKEARDRRRSLLAAAKVILPSAGLPDQAPALTKAPETRAEVRQAMMDATFRAQTGNMPISLLQPTLQMYKGMLKDMEREDEGEDWTSLSDGEMFDRVFAECTPPQLELALQRLAEHRDAS